MSVADHVSGLWTLTRRYRDDPSIRMTTLTNNTDPNTTFQHESVGNTGNKVDMAICCVSFVGCLAIILPYVFNRRNRKLRHSLILGLATSDLVTTIVIIITTGLLLANVNLVAEDGACTFLGYVLVSSIFSQHLWNLTIAVVTWMILVHPLSNFTITIERRLVWLWPIFWIVSFALNASAFGIGGFGFKGGYCSFTTDFYFASIFQFVPRAIVFVVILCLYTHLFFFLRRTNLFKKIGSYTRSNRGQSVSQHPQSQQQRQQILSQSMNAEDLIGADGNDAQQRAHPPGSSEQSSTTERVSGGSNSKNSVKGRLLSILNKDDPHADAQGHRRSSSLGEKDGSLEMVTLDGNSPSRGSHGEMPTPTSIIVSSTAGRDPKDSEVADTSLSGLLSHEESQRQQPRGFLDPNYSMGRARSRSDLSPKHVPANIDIARANRHDVSDAELLSSPHSSSIGGDSSAGQATLSNKGSSAPLISSHAHRDYDEGSNLEQPPSKKVRAPRRPATTDNPDSYYRASHDKEEDGESVEAGKSSRSHTFITTDGGRFVRRRASFGDGLSSEDDDVKDPHSRRMKPRKDVSDFDMITPPVEHLKHVTVPRSFARMTDILAMGDEEMMKANGGARVNGGRRESVVQIVPGDVIVEMPTKEEFDAALGEDWNWGMDVGTAGVPNKPHRSRHTAAPSANGLHTGTSSTSSDENGVDSLGSTLNRQASLLLLLYPLAYCLLFSISIARLIVDMANPALSIKHSHDALHSLSRWLVFAQGAIDALIFQFVERQFRMRMKRRRRKAMGETVDDPIYVKVGKGAAQRITRGFKSMTSSQNHGDQTPTRTTHTEKR